MLHGLVTFAAEAAGEEPNHTAFYICGILLAVWAVLIAFAGMRRSADFPGEGGGKVIIAITVLLVLLATGTSVATA